MQRRLKAYRLGGLDAYLQLLRRDRNEVTALYRAASAGTSVFVGLFPYIAGRSSRRRRLRDNERSRLFVQERAMPHSPTLFERAEAALEAAFAARGAERHQLLDHALRLWHQAREAEFRSDGDPPPSSN